MATHPSDSSTPLAFPALKPGPRALLTSRKANAVLAGAAGIQKSDPSCTQDIEEYDYVFLLKYTSGGPQVDSFLDISPSVMERVITLEAADRLMDRKGPRLIFRMQLDSIFARPRFDEACDGPFVVRSSTALSMGTLQIALRNMATGRLKEFLDGAKI